MVLISELFKKIIIFLLYMNENERSRLFGEQVNNRKKKKPSKKYKKIFQIIIILLITFIFIISFFIYIHNKILKNSELNPKDSI